VLYLCILLCNYVNVYTITFLAYMCTHIHPHHLQSILLLFHIKHTANKTQHTVHTHTYTTILWLCGFCLGQPRLAGTRRNIHPLTLITVINHPNLLSPSTTIHGILSIQSTCFTVFFHNLSPSLLWSTSWSGTIHFILHTFLNPIIIFFLQHSPQ